MPLRAIFLVFLLVLLGTFAVLNWSAIMAPTTLSLLFATVQAPIGFIMLAVTGFLAAVFLAYLVYIQSTVILDTRRSARELAAQRDLADQAEASRFTELRGFLEERLRTIEAAVSDAQSRTESRVDRLEGDLRATAEHTENSIFAFIGELEDRMERGRGDIAAGPGA